MSRAIDTIVLFGASGDLARKLLFPALYRLEERHDLEQRIIGVALEDWTDQDLAKHATAAIGEAIDEPDSRIVQQLTGRLSYVSGDYNDRSTFDRLAATVGSGACLHYMAIPPSFFEKVIGSLATVGLLERSRLLVEKPFGRDLESARALNAFLHGVIDEKKIFRIDHFLGKEPVENLLTFRYANPIIDAIWSRHHIDRVEITMAESFGVDGRGALYDSLGVVRDVVQNHILQIVSLLAMEAPVTAAADAYADERVKVLRAMKAVTPDEVVYGQYEGYRDVKHVAADSKTATFISFTTAINTPRWYGVPFSITAGKALDRTITKAEVVFLPSPPLPFDPDPTPPEANRLVFRIGPSDGVDLVLQTKLPGNGLDLATTPLTVDYDQVFGRIPLAYERVLHDALADDRSQFAREDAVEEAWRIVDDNTDPTTDPIPYATGSAGPDKVPG
jgi:glucose-6-phosphate 1-dehydrogenase